jgi:hypothetical protein
MIKKLTPLASLALIVLLSACSTNTENEAEFSLSSEGQIVEATGTVLKKEISPFGGGTHLLVTEDQEILYALISKIENLDRYLNQEVTLKGEILAQTGDDGELVLDVITVDSQGEPLETAEIATEEFSLASAEEFSLAVPTNWQSKTSNNREVFINASEQEVFTFEKISTETELGASLISELKTNSEYTQITIGSLPAYRLSTQDEASVYLPLENEGYIYVFDYVGPENDPALKLTFLGVVSTLTWTDSSLNSAELKPELEVCGGAENKLCPEGFRCELESRAADSKGFCVAVEQQAEAETTEASLASVDSAEAAEAQEEKEPEPAAETNVSAYVRPAPKPKPTPTPAPSTPEATEPEAKSITIANNSPEQPVNNASSQNTTTCNNHQITCPDGVTIMGRDPDNNCQFKPCPEDILNPVLLSGSCESDAYVCPDGSYLARDPENNCEFPACPPIITSTTSQGQVASLSSDATEATSNSVIANPSSSYGTHTISAFNYSFNYPLNYYFNHLGQVGNIISLVALAPELPETEDDAVIKVGIYPGQVAATSRLNQGSIDLIMVPRNASTHFRVSGDGAYLPVLWDIANSIEIIE